MKFQILIPFSRILSRNLGVYLPELLKFCLHYGPTVEAFYLEPQSGNVEMGHW